MNKTECIKLYKLNFMAICCALGLFAKSIVNPFANVITEALHIPGGISTGFSLMFLVVAAEMVQLKRSGTLMGFVQGMLALALGRIGSMGILTPLGYLAPGIMIDIVYHFMRKRKSSCFERVVLANAAAAIAASIAANMIVFHLRGPVLLLYCCVSATSGSIYGVLASEIVNRVKSAVNHCKMTWGEL